MRIRVENLSKRFGSFVAVDNVSFDVRRGEIYWLAPDPARGSIPSVAHPHVVVQDDVFNHARITTVVAAGYAPDLNPVEYLWAWLKRHALANFCPNSLAELKTTARNKLRGGQRRQSIITACWKQAELW